MNSPAAARPPLDLFISSADTGTETPHDFNMISSDFSITNMTYNMVLQYVNFPNLYPTIKTGVNDTLEISVNNNITLIILPEGFYDGNTFAALLQLSIREVDELLNTAVVQFDSVASKFVFSFPISCKFTNTLGRSTRVAQICGIDYTKTSYSTTYTSNNPVRLHGTSFVDVCLNAGLNSYHTSPGGYNVIARIFFNDEAQFRSIVSREFQVYTKGQIVTGDFFQRMRITLVDEWQQPFVIPPNFNVAYHFVLFPVS